MKRWFSTAAEVDKVKWQLKRLSCRHVNVVFYYESQSRLEYQPLFGKGAPPTPPEERGPD